MQDTHDFNATLSLKIENQMIGKLPNLKNSQSLKSWIVNWIIRAEFSVLRQELSRLIRVIEESESAFQTVFGNVG
jgi:uncharacterized membrane protein